MVDRVTRDRMAGVIERYLDEEITARQLDAGLGEAVRATEDETAVLLRGDVSGYYGDLRGYGTAATRDEWAFLQRMLLLLRSDGELELAGHRPWTLRQLVAGLALFAFGFAVVQGSGIQRLLLACVPLVVLSVLLSRWQHQELRAGVQTDPFGSVSEALSARRRVPGFIRRDYPHHLRTRKMRSAARHWLMSAPWLLICIPLAPLMLLFQAIPDEDWRVVMR